MPHNTIVHCVAIAMDGTGKYPFVSFLVEAKSNLYNIQFANFVARLRIHLEMKIEPPPPLLRQMNGNKYSDQRARSRSTQLVLQISGRNIFLL